jgi:peptide/nickel transport system permease protein
MTFLLRRLSLTAASLWLLTLVAYAISRGGRPLSTAGYTTWLARASGGDFGVSSEWRSPVMAVVGASVEATVGLVVLALALTWLVALPVGVYCATHPGSRGDLAIRGVTFLVGAVPGFVLALAVYCLARLAFDVDLAGGASDLDPARPGGLLAFLERSARLVLPAALVGAAGAAQVLRALRAGLLDELTQPWVTVARAHGMRPRRLLWRFALRVALVPLVAALGQTLAQVISNSIAVSIALGIPTIGQLLLKAVLAQDAVLVGAIVFWTGAAAVLGALLADGLLVWLDPRVRAGAA